MMVIFKMTDETVIPFKKAQEKSQKAKDLKVFNLAKNIVLLVEDAQRNGMDEMDQFISIISAIAEITTRMTQEEADEIIDFIKKNLEITDLSLRKIKEKEKD